MRYGRSLGSRIVAYLVFAQLTAFLVASAVTYSLGLAGLLSYEVGLDVFAIYRVSFLVIQPLTPDGSGGVRIEPTAELRAEISRAPRLQFAAFDSTFAPLPGSSPELADVLAGAIKVNSYHTHFVLPGDPRSTPKGYAAPQRPPFGALQIAVYGQKFRWDDIFYYLVYEFQWSAINILSAIGVSVGAAWFAMQRALHPLRSVSLEATRLDMHLLDQYLSSEELPTEVTPLVTAINDALDRLYASARRLRRYTANAAHELRTPIAIMRARLEDTEEPTFKADLLRDTNHLQAIVEQMLITARLAEGQVSLDEEIELVATTQAIVSRHLPLAVKCQRDLAFEAETSSVVTRGNHRAIECVIANLIDNALRVEPKDGAVLIRVTAAGIVEVSDHGCGVDQCDRNLIFEPFWRKDVVSPGLGLGLAIAKELVEKNRGRIWIEETPGGGSTFKVRLPLPSETS